MANIKWSKEAAATVVVFCMISFVLDMNSLLPRFTDEFTAEHISLRRSLSSSSSIANENGIDIDIDIDIDSYHRYLFAEPTTNDENENDEEETLAALIHGDTDLYTMMATLAANDKVVDDTTSTEISSSNRYTAQLSRYTLEDALKESTIWEYSFCLLIYDPPTDKFIALYNKDSMWNVYDSVVHPVRSFTYLLRQTFPERFMGSESSELVIPIGSGDYPHIIPSKLRHLDGVAPVLMFGSAFRDSTNMYPNMIPMPMTEVHHLGCFVDWIESGKERVCEALTKFGTDNNKEMDELLEWDDLIVSMILCMLCVCCLVPNVYCHISPKIFFLLRYPSYIIH